MAPLSSQIPPSPSPPLQVSRNEAERAVVALEGGESDGADGEAELYYIEK